MGISNVQEDENLANTVMQYPCLCDKSGKGFKERDRKLNAWRKIKEKLGLEEGNYLYFD